MRVVFFGSPEFAVPSLVALAGGFQIAGVVTQPDRPAGRGRHLQPPPVKKAALSLGLPLFQPASVNAEEAIASLQKWSPELIVVAAFGQILRKRVLDLPPLGCLNLHASLLPRWRGASPIQHALLSGDSETGITLMKMDEGMDTGPVLTRRVLAIREDHTAETLEVELAGIAAHLLIDSLPAYLAGQLPPVPQEKDLATYAPRLNRSDGLLDPGRPALELHRRVRALNPRPGTYLRWGHIDLAVLAAHADDAAPSEAPGTVGVRGGY